MKSSYLFWNCTVITGSNIIAIFVLMYLGSNQGQKTVQKIVLNNFMLSINRQTTGQNMYTWSGRLACNIILVSTILLCLATFLCLSSCMKSGPDQSEISLVTLMNFFTKLSSVPQGCDKYICFRQNRDTEENKLQGYILAVVTNNCFG